MSEIPLMKPVNFIALVLFMCGVVWVMTLSEGTVRNIQQAYYGTISPFVRGGSSLEASARDFLREIEHSEDLENQLRAIQGEYIKLRSIEGRLRELETENNELRRALDFQQKQRLNVVAARVIKRQPATWWETAIIDKGQDDSIGAGVPVIAPGGLAGKIDVASEDTCSMILLTDGRCQVSVQVVGTPEVGILHGVRGRYGEEPRLILRHLSREAAILPGMKVITTGKGGLFPSNLLVGTVKEYSPGPVEGVALVKPSVNFDELGVVFVIAHKNGEEEG